MAKPKPPFEPGSRLSEEDRAAWEHAARSLEPLARKRREKRRAEGPSPDPPPDSQAAPRPRPAPVHKAPAPPARRDEPPPIAEIGRRQTRKLSTGQVSIDGRVDLHGMTRAEAHGVLRRFLAAAHERDARWALVITGKGARRGPDLSELSGGFTAPASGVLRRNVPMWLAEPDLRAIVVGFRTAAQAHGGDGALYVQLRQRRRTRS